MYCGSESRLWKDDETLICCPVHGESNPSMGISEEKQVCHCFACGFAGDFAKLLVYSKPEEFGLDRSTPEPYKGETKIVNCTNTKCDNCVNHNYCDYEPYNAETKNEAVELIEKRENVCKTLHGKSAYRALKYIVKCVDKPVTCKACKYSEPCILDKSTFSCSHI